MVKPHVKETFLCDICLGDLEMTFYFEIKKENFVQFRWAEEGTQTQIEIPFFLLDLDKWPVFFQ